MKCTQCKTNEIDGRKIKGDPRNAICQPCQDAQKKEWDDCNARIHEQHREIQKLVETLITDEEIDRCIERVKSLTFHQILDASVIYYLIMSDTQKFEGNRIVLGIADIFEKAAKINDVNRASYVIYCMQHILEVKNRKF